MGTRVHDLRARIDDRQGAVVLAPITPHGVAIVALLRRLDDRIATNWP
ncbi:Hypothetical protein AA314_05806 [Archangium gephyra]|uniref:Uncharacterized protein n=1 Tax=Archangium gephyra TaxID=48 RepID=A0AAC8QAK0_9BACT|nr:Hypothetical protein AA314_05806 [Archangium gephyra]